MLTLNVTWFWFSAIFLIRLLFLHIQSSYYYYSYTLHIVVPFSIFVNKQEHLPFNIYILYGSMLPCIKWKRFDGSSIWYHKKFVYIYINVIWELIRSHYSSIQFSFNITKPHIQLWYHIVRCFKWRIFKPKLSFNKHIQSFIKNYIKSIVHSYIEIEFSWVLSIVCMCSVCYLFCECESKCTMLNQP